MNFKEAQSIAGSLGRPSKMPGFSYGLPAQECKAGKTLATIPGSVCHNCYALKGRYSFSTVKRAQYNRYESLQHPQWVDAMVTMIGSKACSHFRWHDSGDLQGVWHLRNLVEVALRLPDVKFWTPTRETKMVRQYLDTHGEFPPNFVLRVSGAMIDGKELKSFPNTSTVTSYVYEATCPAPNQGGICGECRACWNPAVRNVSYLRH